MLGLPLLFSLENLGQGTDLGTAPTWGDLAFAIPVAMLAYTGLETVANLAAETREPGTDASPEPLRRHRRGRRQSPS